MQIKNKTKDIIKDFASYTQKGGKYYSAVVDIKSISLFVHTELDNNKNEVLEAEIGWSYSTSTMIKKCFDYTEQGFEQMCEWLDEMRIKFVEELL